MKFRVQLVVCTEGQAEMRYEVAVWEKDYHRLEQLGLTRTDAKQLLTHLQRQVVEQQAAAYVGARGQCPACSTPLRVKEHTTRTVRTLFGTIVLTSPRLYHCRCQGHKTTTFRPLTALLTESTTPELLFLETKWAALISYGMTARVLKDFLPVDQTLNATTIQNHTFAVAQRCEGEVEEDQDGVVDSCLGDEGPLSLPKGPFSVGLDGGYVRDWEQKQRHFEVIVGKSVPPDQSAKCFGFVQSYATKAKRRLSAVLQSQGVQDSQPLTFLSDGGDTVRNLPLLLYPQSEHRLDWVHLTMRVTVLGQYLKGLIHLDRAMGEGIRNKLNSVKWLLWHGKVDNALARLGDLDRCINHFIDLYPRFPQLKKAVQQFRTYIATNRAFIPNYGQRYRSGETISTAFVESTVNYVLSKRFVKKQSMQWTKRGAPLLLQTRVKTLNPELASTFHRWYPDLQMDDTALAA
jgi:hypothetical protein